MNFRSIIARWLMPSNQLPKSEREARRETPAFDVAAFYAECREAERLRDIEADNERGRELPHDGDSGFSDSGAATSYPPAPFRPLSEFRAELRQHSQGIPPITEREREEIRAAFAANLGNVSPEAMAIACSPEAMAEIEYAQWIEAGTATTETGVVHESPVAESDAP